MNKKNHVINKNPTNYKSLAGFFILDSKKMQAPAPVPNPSSSTTLSTNTSVVLPKRRKRKAVESLEKQGTPTTTAGKYKYVDQCLKLVKKHMKDRTIQLSAVTGPFVTPRVGWNVPVCATVPPFVRTSFVAVPDVSVIQVLCPFCQNNAVQQNVNQVLRNPFVLQSWTPVCSQCFSAA